MSSRFPQVFKEPQLNIYSRTSGSRHARTKIPRYLRDTDPSLKAVYNWGRWDGSSADVITAKYENLSQDVTSGLEEETKCPVAGQSDSHTNLSISTNPPQLGNGGGGKSQVV